MAESSSDGGGSFELLWPLVGNDLPSHIDSAFFDQLARLGAPSARSELTQTHAERLLLTYHGLLVVYYNRDRIESIETSVVRRVRASPDLLAPSHTASTRMPVLGHEFVAYLLAARRTLDYLRPGRGRVLQAAERLQDQEPRVCSRRPATRRSQREGSCAVRRRCGQVPPPAQRRRTPFGPRCGRSLLADRARLTPDRALPQRSYRARARRRRS